MLLLLVRLKEIVYFCVDETVDADIVFAAVLDCRGQSGYCQRVAAGRKPVFDFGAVFVGEDGRSFS